jgi:hypothetical protein
MRCCEGAPHFNRVFSSSFSLSPLFLLLLNNNLITVRLLREELQLLQEPGSYVGEVIKVREREQERKKKEKRAKTFSPFDPFFFNVVLFNLNLDFSLPLSPSTYHH